MTNRKTLRENDFATLKQVIEAVGPCAMAIEELDVRLGRLERILGGQSAVEQLEETLLAPMRTAISQRCKELLTEPSAVLESP